MAGQRGSLEAVTLEGGEYLELNCYLIRLACMARVSYRILK